jgi:transposase InsO family protein
VKLTPKKVRWLIRHKEDGMSSRDVAVALKITPRRVNQVWKIYRDTGEIPVIGARVGRPRSSFITDTERLAIQEAKQRYKLGARWLELIIERDYGIHIPHNKIHRCLLEEGLAKPNVRKQKRRKWVRYERKHSLSAGHIDWHDGIYDQGVCIITDDSSRKILAGGEFTAQNTENSKLIFKEVVDKYWSIRPMRELIMDHGSAFGAHRTDDKGDWDGEFKRFIEGYGTKPIRIRISHPQSNGKLEKLFDCYELY